MSINRPGGVFPHPAYARYVLEPGFRHAQRLLWPHMMAANEAHTLMLVETGIVSRADAAALMAAQRTVMEAGPEAFSYKPDVEDLFFLVEGRLIELAGPDAGGNLQIARSRNDLGAVMTRMLLRDRLSQIEQLTLQLRGLLIELIGQHIDTLMPGITHTQPAQPTTLAHYLLGVLGPLERDSERLRQAWTRTNRSTLGAAAFTTTSFPIDRDLTARLLGFQGYIENGYDAVGAGDHLLEATQALVTMTGSLSRFVGDLLIWARNEVGVLRVADEFIQISSIMPQKRNPVVLEHIRTRIAYVYGDADAVATMVHGAAFGDTNDVEDPIIVPLVHAFDAAGMVLTLLIATLETAEFNVALLASRAGEGFSTATALADGLTRDFGLPFRTAHHITAQAVKAAIATGAGTITLESVRAIAERELGRPLDITDAWLTDQLDPRRFVAARTLPGGPARSAVATALEAARSRWDDDQAAVDGAIAAIRAADQERTSRIDELVAS
jgi:argininosuccinate lyase